MSDKLRPSVKLYVKEKPKYEGFSGKIWSFDPFDTFDTKLQRAIRVKVSKNCTFPAKKAISLFVLDFFTR